MINGISIVSKMWLLSFGTNPGQYNEQLINNMSLAFRVSKQQRCIGRQSSTCKWPGRPNFEGCHASHQHSR